MTIGALVELYAIEGCVIQRGTHIGKPMKPLTKQYTLSRLRHHVVPLLGKRRAAEINAGDIEGLARSIAAGKTAKDEKVGPRTRVIVRGGEGAARKVIRDLSAVFSFAKRRGIVGVNPVETASVRKTDGKRERFLSFHEIQRLGAALETLKAKGANTKAIEIISLWAMTGCRRNEIAGLKWSEVDLANDRLVLEDTKTGRSVRPLGGPASKLIAEIRQRAQDVSGYVFPAESGSGFYQGTKGVWAKAIKLAGLPEVSPHILRHTLGSMASSSGESLLMVGSLLGHSNSRSSATYAHMAHTPSQRAADRVAGDVALALGLVSPAVAA